MIYAFGFFKKIAHRCRIIAKQLELRRLAALSPSPYWVSYSGMHLPYYSDGDLQEVYYHLHFAEWWQVEKEALSRYLKQGDLVLDIGANIGFMAGIFRGIVGPGGAVHCFEPAPKTYHKLSAVIEKNNWSNVIAHNAGCGGADAVMTLHCARSSGWATLVSSSPNAETEGAGVKVRVVSLDNYIFDRLSRCDLIKIDTEGFEDQVLIGASRLLLRFRPIIYIELGMQYKESSAAAIKILLDLGYKFTREPILEELTYPENFVAIPKAIDREEMRFSGTVLSS